MDDHFRSLPFKCLGSVRLNKVILLFKKLIKTVNKDMNNDTKDLHFT